MRRPASTASPGIFQIGGHAGYAIGPLLAAMIVVRAGRQAIAWVSVVALAAMVLMAWKAPVMPRCAARRSRDQIASGSYSRVGFARRTRADGNDHPDRSPVVEECILRSVSSYYTST